MQSYQTKLSTENFSRYECAYPSNTVIVRMDAHKDLRTQAGILLNFNEDTNYDVDGDDHVAAMCDVSGVIVKQVDRLYFNRKDINKTMNWETEIETMVGDRVWFPPIVAKNCVDILVDDVVYKCIRYEDLFVAKRKLYKTAIKRSIGEHYPDSFTYDVIPLNGNVLLETMKEEAKSFLDVLDHKTDESKGIVRFNGLDNKRYLIPGIHDMSGLKYGDLVSIEKGCYPFHLEKAAYNATFDEGRMYFVIQKRHCLAVLSENN